MWSFCKDVCSTHTHAHTHNIWKNVFYTVMLQTVAMLGGGRKRRKFTFSFVHVCIIWIVLQTCTNFGFTITVLEDILESSSEYLWKASFLGPCISARVPFCSLTWMWFRLSTRSYVQASFPQNCQVPHRLLTSDTGSEKSNANLNCVPLQETSFFFLGAFDILLGLGFLKIQHNVSSAGLSYFSCSQCSGYLQYDDTCLFVTLENFHWFFLFNSFSTFPLFFLPRIL